MDSGVYEIFGTRYYTASCWQLFVAPFVLFFFGALIRVGIRALEGKPFRWHALALSAGCIVIMLFVSFWDIYQIGQEATKLCNEKAGLHVYRTVEAESFLGDTAIKKWTKYGFKFVEYEGRKNKVRVSLENGKPIYKKVNKIVSRYELTDFTEHISPKIDVQKIQVKDRYTGELFGEAIEYSIDGGWADMAFYGMTGFSYSPWICSGRDKKGPFYPSQVVKAIIKPIQKTN